MSQNRFYNAVSELVDANVAAGRGDKLAFIDPARSLTYSALQAATCRMANALTTLGARAEERAVMITLDTVDFPVIFLGAMRAGVVPVPLNTLLTAEHYSYIISDSKARILFVSDVLFPVVEPILAIQKRLSHVVIVGGSRPGYPSLDALLAAESDAFETTHTYADEPAFWLYSSGSTGMPKGVKHVHSSLMATANTFGRQVLGIRAEDVVYSAAKLFFAYGLGNGLTFPLSVGATVILNPDRPVPAGVFAILQKYQPTIYYGVPTLYAAMLNDKALADAPVSPKLRLCVSAGEALPEHVGQEWKKRTGVDIIDGVGSTEMLHIFLSNAPGDIKYGTSGRPVPGYEVRLVNETGQDVSDGDVGEMLVHGPSAPEGYWNQRDKSRATFEGYWTRTGDKYTRDADGRFTYCGRADDMFKVSGIWVSPFEIESALIVHPAVLEAAVVAGMDSDELVKPKAFVVLKDGVSRDGLEDSLKQHVKDVAGAWKYPRWIVFTDALPKTATGKIQRFKLRDLEK